MFLTLLNILAPTFLSASAGYLWGRSGKPFDNNFIALLIMDIGAPCLIISTLGSLTLPAKALLEFGGLILLTLGLTSIVLYLLLRLGGKDIRTFLVPVVFGNHANIGLPVCYFAFGGEGLALALLYYALVSFFHFTAGVALISGDLKLLPMLRKPIIAATLFSFLLLGLDLHLPEWLLNTVTLLGEMTIPLMLVTLGVSLARLRVNNLAESVVLAGYRVFIGLAVGILVATLFELQGVARGVLILQAGMPLAIFNYLLAERYRREPEQVAGMVVVSTLMSVVLLPFVLQMVI